MHQTALLLFIVHCPSPPCLILPMAIPQLKLLSASHRFTTAASFRRSSLLSSAQTSIPTSAAAAARPLRAITEDKTLSSMITELEVDRERAEDGEEMERQPFVPQQPGKDLPQRWREIHGGNNWSGLLDPIDPLLRSELIRYGEFVQACYDAFDYDPYSRYCGSTKFHRADFFSSLGMESCGYEVTRYLYATSNIKLPKFTIKRHKWDPSWSEKADWIGYVAVSGDEATARLGRRDIVVAWRGTVTKLEWVADMMVFRRSVAEEGIPCPDPDVKVESGFIELYTGKDRTCRFCKYSAREQSLTEVRRLVDMYSETGEEVSVSFMGHSLGSALATLNAYDAVETGAAAAAAAVTVFSFAGPRVGNQKFRERFEELGVKALRVFNVHDEVPKVPGFIINEDAPAFVRKVVDWLPWSYCHVGVELELDNKKSPYLKDVFDIAAFHNLEAHLHLLDGFHGKEKEFELVTERDPALVNKTADFLKEEHLVPPNWRQDLNKGMIRADGRWVLQDRPTLDDHPHDIHVHLEKLGLHKGKSA